MSISHDLPRMKEVFKISISEDSEIRSAKTLGKGEFKEGPFSVVHVPHKGIGTSELHQSVQQ